jgi:hypothetical protein
MEKYIFVNMINFKDLVLILLIFIAAWWLYSILSAPIKFANLKKERSERVIEKLNQIKICQEIYMSIKGDYAPNFENLIYVLKNEDIPISKFQQNGNSDSLISKSFTYFPAIDSLKKLNINLDSIIFIPYSNKKKFEIIADKIDYNGKLTPVIQVGARWKEFMGDNIDPSLYKSIDKEYNPDNLLKFGDLTSPNLNGNW